DGEGESPCGLVIDDEVISRGLLEGQVAGLRALENFVDVGGRAPKIVYRVRSIAHETTRLGELAELAYRRQPMLECLRRDQAGLRQQESITHHHCHLSLF